MNKLCERCANKEICKYRNDFERICDFITNNKWVENNIGIYDLRTTELIGITCNRFSDEGSVII